MEGTLKLTPSAPSPCVFSVQLRHPHGRVHGPPLQGWLRARPTRPPQTIGSLLPRGDWHWSVFCASPAPYLRSPAALYAGSDQNPIIRFQFGHLDESQKAKVSPGDTVALAVRTEYDRKKLVGRGFVYVAPTTGPLMPDIIYSKAWTVAESVALLLALIHEAGHIFGLPG